MNRPALRVVIGIIVALVILAGASGAFIWWKIAELKKGLVDDLGKALGARVQIASIDLDLWHEELHAAGISLVNDRPSAPWDKGEISQATVGFHLRDFLAPTMPLKVTVSSWNIVLRPAAAEAPETSADAPSAPTEPTAPSPRSRIQVTQLLGQEGSVEIDLARGKNIVMQGVAFQSNDNGPAGWTTELQAASIVAEPLEAGPSSVHIRADRNQIDFSDLRLQCSQGFVTGGGDIALSAPHVAHATLKLTQIPVTMLVAVAWQMKLSGVANGDLQYQGNDQGGDAKGQLAVSHGKFSILPWVGKLTALVGLEDISGVEVDKATTDFEWKDGVVHLTNLDVRKNDVTRIAGTVDVNALGLVDGRLKLGLPSTVTAKWPLLQEKVFPVQLEDYNWADVHLTGTPDHFQEDLTPRLMEVGMGQGVDLFNQATQKATTIFNSLMGK